jgi:hypothetical protein
MDKTNYNHKDEQMQADFEDDITQEKYYVYSKLHSKVNSSRRILIKPTCRITSLFREPSSIMHAEVSKEKIHIVQSILPSFKQIKHISASKKCISQCRRLSSLISKHRNCSIPRLHSFIISHAV